MPVVDCATGATRDHTPQEQAALDAARAAFVPQVVSARQLKLALLAADKLDDVESFVSAADRAVEISWEYATEFQRTHPLLIQMAAQFGMGDEDIDDIFRAAASL